MTVVPPAVNLWDVDQVNAATLAVLRLSEGDVDGERVADCVAAAIERVDDFVDGVDPFEPTATMHTAAVDTAVAIYRGTGLPSLDPLTGVVVAPERGALPARKRWGVA